MQLWSALWPLLSCWLRMKGDASLNSLFPRLFPPLFSLAITRAHNGTERTQTICPTHILEDPARKQHIGVREKGMKDEGTRNDVSLARSGILSLAHLARLQSKNYFQIQSAISKSSKGLSRRLEACARTVCYPFVFALLVRAI